MRLLILILLFPFIAQGQIVRTHPYYRPTAAACTPLLLDTYSGAAAAYSLRKLDCDYAGSAIRVRRSSDNTESDIGFTSNGDLDTAALKTFVGTGGTDDGFVVIWYDQSGNSRNATQSTAGNQPKIMDNGVIYRKNSLPAVYFIAANNTNLTATFTSFSSSTSTVFGVFYSESGSDLNTRVFSFCTANKYDYEIYAPFIQNASTITEYGAFASSGFRAMVTGFSNTVLNLYTGINDGTKIKNSRNNGTDVEYTYTVSTANLNRFTIGSTADFTGVITDGNLKGYVSELIMYNSDKTTDKSNINSSINTYYSIY